MKRTFCVFFLLSHHYLILSSSPPHPWRAVKILKPLAIYSSLLTTLSPQPVFMRLQLKMKISSWHLKRSALDCLSGKEKENDRRRQDGKKKQETKRENKLGACRQPMVVGRLPVREEDEQTRVFVCACGGVTLFSYLTFRFYLPGFRAVDRGVPARGRRGV